MSEFKAGDRVTVNKDAFFKEYVGRVGTVVDVPQVDNVEVEFDDGGANGFLRASLDLLDRPSDNINHPDHYKWLPVEAIDITEHFNFLLGNVLKYVLRADHKGTPLEDLKKARWYLSREIENREAKG